MFSFWLKLGIVDPLTPSFSQLLEVSGGWSHRWRPGSHRCWLSSCFSSHLWFFLTFELLCISFRSVKAFLRFVSYIVPPPLYRVSSGVSLTLFVFTHLTSLTILFLATWIFISTMSLILILQVCCPSWCIIISISMLKTLRTFLWSFPLCYHCSPSNNVTCHDLSISDHCFVTCKLGINKPPRKRKTISFRSFLGV